MRKVIINKNCGENIQQKKQEWSPLRKALNELDPNFDKKIRIVWKIPPLRLKDLKAKLKKERDMKMRQKRNSNDFDKSRQKGEHGSH